MFAPPEWIGGKAGRSGLGVARLALSVSFLLACNSGISLKPQAQSQPEERPVWWSPELGLSSLDKIDAELRRPFPSAYKAIIESGAGGSGKKASAQRVTIENCTNYLALAGKSYTTGTPLDDASLSAAGLRCHALRALHEASPAKSSFVSDLHLDAKVLGVLPPTLGVAVAPAELARAQEAAQKGISWGAYEGGIKISPLGADSVELEGGDWIADLTLYARGDFDGDGTEDLLVRRDGRFTRGTYRISTLFVLTRTEKAGILRVIEKFE